MFVGSPVICTILLYFNVTVTLLEHAFSLSFSMLHAEVRESTIMLMETVSRHVYKCFNCSSSISPSPSINRPSRQSYYRLAPPRCHLRSAGNGTSDRSICDGLKDNPFSMSCNAMWLSFFGTQPVLFSTKL